MIQVGGRGDSSWQDTVSTDMHLLRVDTRNVQNRVKWRAIGQPKAKQGVSGMEYHLTIAIKFRIAVNFHD